MLSQGGKRLFLARFVGFGGKEAEQDGKAGGRTLGGMTPLALLAFVVGESHHSVTSSGGHCQLLLQRER